MLRQKQMPLARASSRLPTELWHRILRSSMGLGDTVENPVESNGAFNYDVGTISSRSMDTRLSIVQVCRHWNAIATPLLYEHISISSEAQCQMLLRTLTQTARASSPGVGRVVKRLDMLGLGTDFKGFRIHSAARLCEKMPNLLVAVMLLEACAVPYPLLETLPAKLVHLHWIDSPGISDRAPIRQTRTGSFQLPISDVLKFLERHPQLVSIGVPFTFASQQLSEPSPMLKNKVLSIVEWTFQRASQLSSLASSLRPGSLPCLRTIRLQSRAASEESRPPATDLSQFLSAHGEFLTTLHLSRYPDFCVVADKCPLVDEVHVSFARDIDVDDWLPGAGWVRDYRMQQVTTLGVYLRSYTRCPRSYHIEHLHRIVAAPWTKILPRLNRIRIMEEVDVDEYREHVGVSRSALRSPGRWCTQPIRVEDIGGRCLAQFSKGVCALIEVEC